MNESLPPDALLLLGPGCAHCPAVLDALARLLEEGALGRLEAVNVRAHPERARELGVRSVPWVRLGPFELEGVHGYGELAQWAEHAARGTGLGDYYAHLLESRQLERVVAMIREHPEGLVALVTLLGRAETPMGVRIGIGAVFEALQGTGLLDAILPELDALTRVARADVRADACHYLGLTGNPVVIPWVERLLDDPSRDVREIAQETLETLKLPEE